MWWNGLWRLSLKLSKNNMQNKLDLIERMSLKNYCVPEILKEIIKEVEKLPTEFPDYESDMYDLGAKEFQKTVLILLKS